MSLLLVTTSWLGTHLFKTAPTSMYGFILFMCAISYYLLQNAILDTHEEHSLIKQLFYLDAI